MFSYQQNTDCFALYFNDTGFMVFCQFPFPLSQPVLGLVLFSIFRLRSFLYLICPIFFAIFILFYLRLLCYRWYCSTCFIVLIALNVVMVMVVLWMFLYLLWPYFKHVFYILVLVWPLWRNSWDLRNVQVESSGSSSRKDVVFA